MAVAAVVLAAVTASACAGGSGGSANVAPAATTTPMSLGQAVYQRSCARCHGVSLEGRGATPAIDAVRLRGLGDQRLRLAIANGKGEMPAFNGLSQAQVDALIAYLYTMQ